MNKHQLELLESIRQELQTSPEFAAFIIDAMTMGLKESAKIQAHRAADMEVVASMALHNRLFKGQEKFIAQKLRTWENRSSLRWDDVLEKLESK